MSCARFVFRPFYTKPSCVIYLSKRCCGCIQSSTWWIVSSTAQTSVVVFEVNIYTSEYRLCCVCVWSTRFKVVLIPTGGFTQNLAWRYYSTPTVLPICQAALLYSAGKATALCYWSDLVGFKWRDLGGCRLFCPVRTALFLWLARWIHIHAASCRQWVL